MEFTRDADLHDLFRMFPNRLSWFYILFVLLRQLVPNLSLTNVDFIFVLECVYKNTRSPGRVVRSTIFVALVEIIDSVRDVLTSV